MLPTFERNNQRFFELLKTMPNPIVVHSYAPNLNYFLTAQNKDGVVMYLTTFSSREELDKAWDKVIEILKEDDG
jgi:hypothetical protein